MNQPRFRLLRSCALTALLALFAPSLFAAGPDIFPLSQVKAGMKGEAVTIFAGEQSEKFDFVVIGVMPNFLGPKESVILVQLVGAKVEHTGVVAGMSGSPCYIDGKLAGALSLKLGQFAKEPLAGITPIENILSLPGTPPAGSVAQTAQGAPDDSKGGSDLVASNAGILQGQGKDPQFSIPSDWASRNGVPAGKFLTPIASPLVFSGFSSAAIRQFAGAFEAYGMEAAQGGTADPQPNDKDIHPGDMVSAILLEGDISINASCTVTAIVDGRVYVCGHPLFGFGSVQLPMARAHVLTTLSSDLESTKIVNAGGSIGTFDNDRVTAVTGTLGAVPKMIPIDMTVVTPSGQKTLSFRMISNPKITPLLMGLASLNGLVQNSVYSEGTTFHLSGGIDIEGHSSVDFENWFAPTDQFIPDGTSVAGDVQGVFQRIFANPYETAKIQRVNLRMEAMPDRRQTTIEAAWPDKTEAAPGDTVKVKVQLRPYRGSPVIKEVSITIPPQAVRGSQMQVLASDSGTLNRLSAVAGSQARLQNLDQLIAVMNRERRNDRLYVTLLEPLPTMVLQDKVMPNVPTSQINLLDPRLGPNSSVVMRDSAVGEWSVPLEQIVQGSTAISIRIK